MLFKLLLTILLLQSKLFCVAVDVGDVARHIILDGVVSAHKSVSVTSPFTGKVTMIIEDATVVKKGDVLFELDTYQIKQELEMSKIRFFLKELEEKKLRNTHKIAALTDSNALIESKKNYEVAKEQLEVELYARGAVEMKRKQLGIWKNKQMIGFYKNHIKELEGLSKKGALSTIQLNDEKLKYKEFQINLQQMELDFEKLKAGDLLKIEKAKRSLKKAQMKYEHLKKQNSDKEQERKSALEIIQIDIADLKSEYKLKTSALESSKVKAKHDGIFLIKKHWVGNGRDLYKIGHQADEGGVIGKISVSKDLDLTFEVDEKDMANIKMGQKLSFQATALGEKDFKAQVYSIDQSITEASGRWQKDYYHLKNLNVSALIDIPDLRLKPRMTALAKLLIERKKDVKRVPINCLNASNELQTIDGTILKDKVVFIGDDYAQVHEVNDSLRLKCKQALNLPKQLLNKETITTTSEFIDQVSGTGELKVRNEILLSPFFSTTIKSILKSGKEVKKGDILISLDTKDIDTDLQAKEVSATEKAVDFKSTELKSQQGFDGLLREIEELNLQFKVANKKLEILNREGTDIGIQKAKLNMKKSQVESDYQRLYFGIQTELKNQGYIKSLDYQKSFESLKSSEIEMEISKLEDYLENSPKSRSSRKIQALEVESIETKIKNKKEQLESEKANLDLDIKFAKLQLDLANFDVEILRDKKKNSEIKADKDGYFLISDHWAQGKIVPYKVGDNTSPGGVIGRLVEFENFYIKGLLEENTYHRLRVGQKIKFHLKGRAEQKFEGILNEISSAPRLDGTFSGGTPRIHVKISVEAKSKSFQPGSSVQYEVLLTKKRQQLSIPFKALYQDKDKYFVFTSSSHKKVEVSKGIVQNQKVEILSGLAEGQSIFWQEQE
ncbi:MAG: hypothetical protein KC646_13105 [Candidatus Cloacimonetes bacterium]|nr:hypothetical protein [Candidatus Cloacimonadota bacterium]